MIICEQDKLIKGLYYAKEYCDICQADMSVVGIQGYNKCKTCKKTICPNCKYSWNNINKKIEKGGGYFDTIYCLEHCESSIPKGAET